MVFTSIPGVVPVDISSFGGKADGLDSSAAANDTAFTNAYNAVVANGGGAILVPWGATGVYKTNTGWIIDADNVSLIGTAGERGGSPTIQIASTKDPTYALIVGNTKNVKTCMVQGLLFQGRNSATSTGGGINFRSNGGKLLQVKVALFGGTGINVNSFSGTIFEIFGDDLNLIQNGMNSTTPGDNLVLGGGISDCEWNRVLSYGDSGKSTTRHCINNGANQQKFINCHCYFASHDGFSNTGNGCQIIGGEYETNGTNGIENSNPGFIVRGIAGFGNLNTDIATYAQATIEGCALSSTGVFENIYVSSANGGVIADNLLSGIANNIVMDTGAAGYSVHDNVCSGSIATKATNSTIHDNQMGGTIIEQTGANNNDIHENSVASAITLIGSTTKIRNNPGHNPIGSVSTPGFPATTVAATNNSGYDVTAFISNGINAITQVQVAGAGGSYVNTNFNIAASGWATIRIPVGGSVKFTYAGGAPAWVWMGD